MEKVHITKISGYVDTPIDKRCGTCNYLKQGRICVNKVVAKDDEVPTAGGKKIVNARNGCCDEWKPPEAKDGIGSILFG